MTGPSTPPWTTAPDAVPRRRYWDREVQDPTARELVLLDLMAAGYTVAAAAQATALAYQTAAGHLHRLAARWRTRSRPHLVGAAFDRGWLVPVHHVPLDALTARHREILALTGCGATDKEIGAELALSEASVRELAVEARERLGVHKLAHAVALWHCAPPERHTPADGAAAVELTGAQVRVAQLLAQGMPPRGITAELGLSARSLGYQLARLRRTTGSGSNAEVALYGLRTGQLPVPERAPLELDPMDEAICMGIARGAGIPEIACELEMPVGAVWEAWRRVRGAVGAASRLEAVLALYAAGVLRPDRAPCARSLPCRPARVEAGAALCAARGTRTPRASAPPTGTGRGRKDGC